MCDPVTLAVISFGVGAAQSIASYSAAKKQKAANDAAAARAYENDQTQLTTRQIQEEQKALQDKYTQNLEQARAQANVANSAAGAGVGGVSVNNLTAEVGRRASRNRVNLDRNLAMTAQQLQIDKEGSRAHRQSQINAVPVPNPISLVAGIAGAGLDAFSSLQ